jgi:membrane fusion protein (multidrug efflux system)
MENSTEAIAVPANGSTVHSPAHTASHKRRKTAANSWKPALGVVTGLALVAWFGQLAVHAYHYVETDDAYITGHLHQISPQLDGQVKEVLVTENQTVHAGDVLVRLDALEFELALEKTRAVLAQAHAQEAQTRAAAAQAEAQVAEAQARVTQAEAQVAQAAAQLELARLTLTRNEQLFASGGAITQAELDNARSGFRAAEAAHAASQANLTAAHGSVGSALAAQNSTAAQITAASANIAVAEAAVRDAERKLSYTTIKAPADGRVGNKTVEVGNRVVAGQSLISLAAPDMWVVANFKETQLARMQAGEKVDLSIDALPDSDGLHGTIESLAPASGAQFALLPPDNATGNFNKVVQRIPVKITLDGASHQQLGERLRLGLSVIVNVKVR